MFIVLALTILHSTADYSTTVLPSLVLFVAGCWARRQLPNCIRYVSITSKPRNSLSSVERIFMASIPGYLLLDGILLHNHLTNCDSVYGELLGSMSAS